MLLLSNICPESELSSDELTHGNWNCTSLGLNWLGNSFSILQNVSFVFFVLSQSDIHFSGKRQFIPSRYVVRESSQSQGAWAEGAVLSFSAFLVGEAPIGGPFFSSFGRNSALDMRKCSVHWKILLQSILILMKKRFLFLREWKIWPSLCISCVLHAGKHNSSHNSSILHASINTFLFVIGSGVLRVGNHSQYW